MPNGINYPFLALVGTSYMSGLAMYSPPGHTLKPDDK